MILPILEARAEITSVSKKPGQTILLYHYYGLSRFFWNRCYMNFIIIMFECSFTISKYLWDWHSKLENFLIQVAKDTNASSERVWLIVALVVVCKKGTIWLIFGCQFGHSTYLGNFLVEVLVVKQTYFYLW